MQSVLKAIYPPQCLSCDTRVMDDHGFCPSCWGGAGFIMGLVCDKCGVPLLGEETGEAEFCDDCLTIARPWARGRAALTYTDTGRRITLALKHGDRMDIVKPAAEWMARAARPIAAEGMVVTPVPLHWLRAARRRYNQSGLLGRQVARLLGLTYKPDLLVRARHTASQDGRNREDRFANIAGAIRAHPRRRAQIERQHVLVVDDVITSGATFAACADALLAAGAAEVSVLSLARVAKTP